MVTVCGEAACFSGVQRNQVHPVPSKGVEWRVGDVSSAVKHQFEQFFVDQGDHSLI